MTHPLYGLINAKRPVGAKALIINAFALAGRIVLGGFLPQGVALGYVLLPLWGVLLRLLAHPLEQANNININNVLIYCSGYGGDAIASYYMLFNTRSLILLFVTTILFPLLF